MSILTTFIQRSTGSPSHRNQRRKRNKRNSNLKEVKLSLFADDKILYIENPEDFPKNSKKLLELTNEFSEDDAVSLINYWEI